MPWNPALPPLATPDDIAVRLEQTFTDAQTARAAAVLAEASTLVRDETGKDWVDLTVDPPRVDAPDLVVSITIASAKRAFLNPAGVLSESIGPFTYRRDRGESMVVLTPGEKTQLNRFRQDARGLWNQQLTNPLCLGPQTEFIPVEGGGDEIPWLSDNEFSGNPAAALDPDARGISDGEW